MSTTALSNDFLLDSAKKQLGFKPTAQVSLSDVDSLRPHQRYLSEQRVLMTSLPSFNPLALLCGFDVDRTTLFPKNILKS
jgi:hypothetical protein